MIDHYLVYSVYNFHETLMTLLLMTSILAGDKHVSYFISSLPNSKRQPEYCQILTDFKNSSTTG